MKISNEIVIERAKGSGFNLIGFSPAEELTDEIKKLEEWLKRDIMVKWLIWRKILRKGRMLKIYSLLLNP